MPPVRPVATRPTVALPVTTQADHLLAHLTLPRHLTHLLDQRQRQEAAVILRGIRWEALVLRPVATRPPPLLTQVPRQLHLTRDLAQAPGIHHHPARVGVDDTALAATPAALEAPSLVLLVAIHPLHHP